MVKCRANSVLSTHLSSHSSVIFVSRFFPKGLIDVIRRELPDLAPMQDGDGKYGSQGIPLDGVLWKELC